MKKFYLFSMTLLLLLFTPSFVLAGPTTAVSLAETSAVNLPSVLGAFLSLVAVLLPFTLRAWARRNWDENGQ